MQVFAGTSVSSFATITSFNDVEEPVDGRVFFRVELGPGSHACLPFQVVEHTTNDILIGFRLYEEVEHCYQMTYS